MCIVMSSAAITKSTSKDAVSMMITYMICSLAVRESAVVDAAGMWNPASRQNLHGNASMTLRVKGYRPSRVPTCDTRNLPQPTKTSAWRQLFP